ncbi:MAG: rhomboid family intramembrane serine protease [Thermodesulfobacteriota bacterium]
MIPLKDNVNTAKFPFVNYLLLTLNIILFAYVVLGENNLNRFYYEYGLIPAKFISVKNFDILERIKPFFTSMFIHGSLFHITGNMLFLYIFGDNIEDEVGHFNYIIFFLICGFVAALFQIFSNMNSQIPMIGASGAVSGVLGAYLVFFPYSRILTLVPIFIFIQLIYIRASIFIFIWFLIQFISGVVRFGLVEGAGGIAFWAHIGGFLCGILFANIYRNKQIRHRIYH